MPRLAGVWAGPREAASLLSLLPAPQGGICCRLEAGNATLAWLGTGEPALARIGQRLAVVDGRFYNPEELPAGPTPAHVLLDLCHRYGFVPALQRINGDFAAAVLDLTAGELWLGRDRFGLRSLYYARTGDGLAFCSRPAPLLRLPGVSGEPDRRFVALVAASHYRTFDNAPEASPYAGVFQVPAATALCCKDGRIVQETYWRLTDGEDSAASEEELAEQYRALLLDAVGRRLSAAERPAFTLSGGMDSSSVLACASRLAGRKFPALSTVYQDKTFDESLEIRPMAEAACDPWLPVTVGHPDVFALVERLVAHHDEPVATATWLSHFLLCEEAAARGFGTLFGGLGGDELNAGEYEYFFFHFADLLAAGRSEELENEIACWARHHDHPVYRKNREAALATLARVTDAARPGRCLSDRDRMLRYAAALDPGFFDMASFTPVMEHPFSSALKNRAWQDISRETAPCCLRAGDRNAAACGLENMLPFFDHRLVEFMFRVPGRLKIRQGVTKHLLRRAMQGVLPEETRLRVKKTGWNAPAHVWFTGSGLEQVLDLIRSRSFRERGVYVPAEAERLAREHASLVASGQPRENHMMFLWQLVNLETWLRLLDQGRIPGNPGEALNPPSAQVTPCR